MPNDTRSNRRVTAPRSHPHCVVCGENDALGLGLTFVTRDDGSVECDFQCSPALQGYTDQLHGGVIALLLDGAMTNCLFAHGHAAVTAEINVRYRHPVAASQPVYLRAWPQRFHPRLNLLAAELVQEGQVKATATAKFIDQR